MTRARGCPRTTARVLAALAPRLDAEQAMRAWRAAASVATDRHPRALAHLAGAFGVFRVPADTPAFAAEAADCGTCEDVEEHRAARVASDYGHYLAVLLSDAAELEVESDEADAGFAAWLETGLAEALHVLGCPVDRPLRTLLPQLAGCMQPPDAAWVLHVLARSAGTASSAAMWDAAVTVTDPPWNAVACAAASLHDRGAAPTELLAEAIATALDDAAWVDDEGWRRYTVDALLEARLAADDAAALADLLRRLADPDDVGAAVVAEHARGGDAFARVREVEGGYVPLDVDALAAVVLDAPSVGAAVEQFARLGLPWTVHPGLAAAAARLPADRLADLLAVRVEEDVEAAPVVVAAVAERCDADPAAAAAAGVALDAALAAVAERATRREVDLETALRLRARLGTSGELLAHDYVDVAKAHWPTHPFVVGALQEELAHADRATRVRVARALLAEATGLTWLPLVRGVMAVLPAVAPRADSEALRKLAGAVR